MENTYEKLPQKVEMMFRAVIEMVNEGSDINTMKVQDITKRAGIGKGTAYEYFSSKEELIGKAIDWNLRSEILGLAQAVEEKACFRDRIFCILDFMDEKVRSRNRLVQMLGTSSNSCCISHNMKEALQETRYPELIRAFLADVMKAGMEEGVLNPQGSVYNRNTSLISQLMMFLAYLKQDSSRVEEPVETVKEQIYQNLLLLNR